MKHKDSKKVLAEDKTDNGCYQINRFVVFCHECALLNSQFLLFHTCVLLIFLVYMGCPSRTAVGV